MVNYKLQADCFQQIERLLNNGRTFSTLPITQERARGILTMREVATGAELKMLSDESNKLNP
jgi:hypothetical protein